MTDGEPSAFGRLTKPMLFFIFFSAFITIGFIPFLVVKYYTLKKVENEMRSSLNESYYLITERITDIIDRAYIRRWISNLEQLRQALDFHVVADQTFRQTLLNTFFQNEAEMVVLSLKYPDADALLHFIKQDRLQELTRAEPDAVAHFFQAQPTIQILDMDWITTAKPVIFRCCQKVFLPVEVVFQWDAQNLARIRCIYDLTPALALMDSKLPLGDKHLYIVDRNGIVIFSNKSAHKSPNNRFDLPIMAKITESLEGKTRMFQLELFQYDKTDWVGNFATTRYLNWAVAVVEKESSAYALVKETKSQVVIWAMVAFLLCVAVAAFFAWFFSLLIDRARKQLENARDAAETASRAKSEFLANISHEIRTPLNSILGFSDILENKLAGSPNRRYIALIRSSGKSLLTLINDILDLSKIEAGKMDLVYTPVELRKLFEEIAGIFSLKIQEKGLRFILEIDDNLPDYMLIDEIRLRQILLNLVGNAVKFTNSGHIRLIAERWSIDRDPKIIDLVIWVEDTGIGIPEDQLESIFGAFQQQSGQNVAAFGGTGLGLAISRRLLEMMGGAIIAQGRPGKGSSFTLRLPNVAKVLEPSPVYRQNDLPTKVRFKSATILIADDVTENRILLKSFLEGHPFRFLEAKDGQQAIELAKTHCPDLILMDMKMPVISGKRALNILKQADETKSIPVIAATASVLNDEETEIRSLSDGFIRKPITRDELLGMLSKFLDCTKEMKKSAIAAILPNKSQPMTREQRKHLPQLIHMLESTFMSRWETLNDMLIMDELIGFSADLITCARQFHHQELEWYAQKLNQCAKEYDVAAVGKRMAEFPQIVKKVKGSMQ
jgi:signal transduction histidine kinase/DNA-binding NarL/FixJ family response regulator